MNFTAVEVITIVSLCVGLTAIYFGLRQLIIQVKYDTTYTREWVTTDARDQIRDLHEWHDTRDEDGRLKWINSVKLEDAMVSIAESNKDLVRLLEVIHKKGEVIEKKVDKVLAQHG